jgi:hypothetical protein
MQGKEMSTAQPHMAEGLTAGEWDQVHRQVQAALDPLRETVRRALPAIVVRSQRLSSRAFPLHSYLEFSWPHETEFESVIAGVLIAHSADGGLEVEGDIGGEATGCTYFGSARLPVSANAASVIDAARTVAAQLAKESERLIQGLQERRAVPS